MDFENEINMDAKLTPTERVALGAFLFWPLLFIIAVGIVCGGCMSENTGSSTVVGEQIVLPEITDSSDNIGVRVFEDIKGARVWTAKDSKVTIRYANSYTNNYFGIAETRCNMALDVDIEPLATDGEYAGHQTSAD